MLFWIECRRVSFEAVRPTTERQAIAWALVFSSIPDLFLREILLDHPLRLANGDPLSENTDLLTRNCNILIDAATVADRYLAFVLLHCLHTPHIMIVSWKNESLQQKRQNTCAVESSFSHIEMGGQC